MSKYKERLFFFVILFSLVISCKPKIETPISQQHDAVMEIHDEVMPKMRDIYKLKKRLKKSDHADTELFQNAITQLETADKAMMDWMRAYQKPKEGDSNALNYLSDQMDKVQIVKSMMLNSILQGEKILNENL